MDYLYLSNCCPGDRKGGQALSTKELQRQLRAMGKSDKGPRNELVKRYDRELPQAEADGERDGDREKGGTSHATARVGEPDDGNGRRVHRKQVHESGGS